MLTRLKVNGFKNLVNVDVRFGPFTCIAGANGSGKSNLFDAIRFLSALADKPLVDAALSLRGDGGGLSDIRNLFHRVGDSYAPEMTFEAEMIVPPTGIDDLGQEAEAECTLLRYHLTLRYRGDRQPHLPLEIISERLEPGDVAQIAFPYSAEWLDSAVKTGTGEAFIATLGEQLIRKSTTGSTQRLSATTLPRTVISATLLASDATILLARREMQSWAIFHFLPLAMRENSQGSKALHLSSEGGNLAAYLYGLAHDHTNWETGEPDPEQIYQTAANELAALLDYVRDLRVDYDEIRERYTLYLRGRNTWYPARALSDGTLRFLAMIVLFLNDLSGLFAIEEPENGLHPSRLRSLIDLLMRSVCDTQVAVEDGNPLRQIVINTHDIHLVQQIPEDTLLIAQRQFLPTAQSGSLGERATFRALSATWRAAHVQATEVLPTGDLLAFLDPVDLDKLPGELGEMRRVVDRDEMRDLIGLVYGPQGWNA
jgi:predicted ATPase